jgi:hypothetical protein
VERDFGVGALRKHARFDSPLQGRAHFGNRARNVGEPLPFPADLRHGAVDEHQVEVFGMLTAEPVVAEKPVADPLERLGQGFRVGVLEQLPEAFLGQSEKQVVFAGKVAVEGSGAVFDLLRDLPNGDVAVALGDEELARSVQDLPPDFFPLALLPFLDAHVWLSSSW